MQKRRPSTRAGKADGVKALTCCPAALVTDRPTTAPMSIDAASLLFVHNIRRKMAAGAAGNFNPDLSQYLDELQALEDKLLSELAEPDRLTPVVQA